MGGSSMGGGSSENNSWSNYGNTSTYSPQNPSFNGPGSFGGAVDNSGRVMNNVVGSSKNSNTPNVSSGGVGNVVTGLKKKKAAAEAEAAATAKTQADTAAKTQADAAAKEQADAAARAQAAADAKAKAAEAEAAAKALAEKNAAPSAAASDTNAMGVSTQRKPRRGRLSTIISDISDVLETLG